MTNGHRLNGSRIAGLLAGPLSERGTPSERIHLDPGTVIFEEGGAADAFYVVERGRIRLELSTPGRPTTIVQTIGPGDLVGLSWFTVNGTWSWDARAVVDTDLRVFDAAAVRAACADDDALRADIGSCVAAEAIRRLHAARLQMIDLFGGAT